MYAGSTGIGRVLSHPRRRSHAPSSLATVSCKCTPDVFAPVPESTAPPGAAIRVRCLGLKAGVWPVDAVSGAIIQSEVPRGDINAPATALGSSSALQILSMPAIMVSSLSLKSGAAVESSPRPLCVELDPFRTWRRAEETMPTAVITDSRPHVCVTEVHRVWYPAIEPAVALARNQCRHGWSGQIQDLQCPCASRACRASLKASTTAIAQTSPIFFSR